MSDAADRALDYLEERRIRGDEMAAQVFSRFRGGCYATGQPSGVVWSKGDLAWWSNTCARRREEEQAAREMERSKHER